jgi:hypothetical protein
LNPNSNRKSCDLSGHNEGHEHSLNLVVLKLLRFRPASTGSRPGQHGSGSRHLRSRRTTRNLGHIAGSWAHATTSPHHQIWTLPSGSGHFAVVIIEEGRHSSAPCNIVACRLTHRGQPVLVIGIGHESVST